MWQSQECYKIESEICDRIEALVKEITWRQLMGEDVTEAHQKLELTLKEHAEFMRTQK